MYIIRVYNRVGKPASRPLLILWNCRRADWGSMILVIARSPATVRRPMPSSLPGMDPYLENPILFPDPAS